MKTIKLEQMRKEADYTLQHHIIEPSDSDWSSPCVLAPKKNGTFCFSTDFRKLDALKKTDFQESMTALIELARQHM